MYNIFFIQFSSDVNDVLYHRQLKNIRVWIIYIEFLCIFKCKKIFLNERKFRYFYNVLPTYLSCNWILIQGTVYHFQAQMVRRVKAYLKNMKVITDEEKLLAMSMECEPPSGGIQIAQPSVGNDNFYHIHTMPLRKSTSLKKIFIFSILQRTIILMNSNACYLFVLRLYTKYLITSEM